MKNNKDKNLISINVLEFVIVIINYCAALTVVVTEHVTDDPHLVLLNAVDKMSAHSWTTNTYKSSRIGRLLAKFFVTSKWIMFWVLTQHGLAQQTTTLQMISHV